ncbi:MAG: hypothetical protein E7Z65_06445 [Thermoplasmata archaeon]|nr:hypothetical protein [Thermoplasmata archaeon]
MRKAVIILIIAAVAVLGGLLVIGMTASTDPDAEYNYKYETASSFMSDSGYLQTPSEGNQFVILTYHIYNENSSTSITTNPIIWQFKILAGGLEYGSSSMTFLHPGYKLVDIPKGSDTTCVQVFEIPETYSIKDLSVSVKILNNLKIEYNNTLAV